MHNPTALYRTRITHLRRTPVHHYFEHHGYSRPPRRGRPARRGAGLRRRSAGGGTATVVFSRDKNAGVLVMNNVTPPKAGTVYQMWLIDAKGPQSAGTMDATSVAPSTTAVLPDLGDSNTLAFTVEPAGGSAQPTSAPFAALPLS